MKPEIAYKAKHILERLRQDEMLGEYIGPESHLPQAYRGTGDIKLIILGQDPTVEDPLKRQNIDTVLNLNHRGGAGVYLSQICRGIGIERKQNIYVTNVLKNFFTSRPTDIKATNIFKKSFPYWLPLLMDELSEFNGVPVITLGEPVLQLLSTGENQLSLSQYWGHTDGWQETQTFGKPKYVKAADNLLHHTLFPFPHLQTLRKDFYRIRMSDYIQLVRITSFCSNEIVNTNIDQH